MRTDLPKHMPALDGLRGVAILMVIVAHVGAGWPAALSIIQDTNGMKPTFMLPPWLAVMVEAADNGVRLFFVVSAFTLTVRAYQSPSSLGSYALRRVARVGPGYWLAGIGYTLLAGLGPRLWAPKGVSPIDLAIAALFGSAWAGGASFAVVPGGWSVSVEIAFYLALPLLIRVIDGRIWRTVALTALTMAIAQLRAQHIVLAGQWTFFELCNPIEQAPVFLCGVTAALISLKLEMPRWPQAAVALLFLAIAALPFSPINPLILLPYLPFAVFVAIAAAISAIHPSRLLNNRAIGWIGKVSYSMYLVHFAVLPVSLKIAERLFPASNGLTVVAHFTMTVAATFAIACLTYRYVELPPIRWAGRQKGKDAILAA